MPLSLPAKLAMTGAVLGRAMPRLLGKWQVYPVKTPTLSYLPGLRGFSASNIKNMRSFYEEWVPALEANHQLPTSDLDSEIPGIVIRQLSTGELDQESIRAFLRTGFTHHIEIITQCKDFNERWYYIKKNAAEFWSVETLRSHIRAKDYSSHGGLHRPAFL
jgi:hypothetical protein